MEPAEVFWKWAFHTAFLNFFYPRGTSKITFCSWGILTKTKSTAVIEKNAPLYGCQ